MSYVCPRCAKRSDDPDDERHGYCGNCHEFTGEDVALIAIHPALWQRLAAWLQAEGFVIGRVPDDPRGTLIAVAGDERMMAATMSDLYAQLGLPVPEGGRHLPGDDELGVTP